MNEILVGDALTRLRELPSESVHCCITSPPYWGLRDYGVEGQLGLEPTPQAYVNRMVEVFREVRRVLRADGTLWLNIGDSYAGSGRGRNSDGAHSHKPTDKQASNRGSIAGRLLRPANQSAGAGPRIGSGSSFRRDRMKRQDDPHKAAPGLKAKDLVGVPWRLAFALQSDGWWLRQDIIWHKPNPMPESVTDRCTKAHEYVFLLTKSEAYHFDADAICEPAAYAGDMKIQGAKSLSRGQAAGANVRPSGNATADRVLVKETRNKRTVWTVPTAPFPEAHFATFPEKLVEPCILAGCPEGGVVLDPFMGSGTVALVALKARRQFLGIELNPEYAAMARRRIQPELAQGRLA